MDDLIRRMDEESHPRERAIAKLAARQYGVLAYWQLSAAGLSKDEVYKRVRVGRLHRLYQGVYAVGHTALPPKGFLIAAVYACGEGAVLSHRNAAELWDLRRTSRGDIDVTVVSRGRKPRKGMTLHQVRRLHRADWTIRDRIPVTSLARTFLDNAEVLNGRQLVRQLDAAERHQILNLRAINDVCNRNPGRHGIPILIAAVNDLIPEAVHSRSEFESTFLDFCRAYGIPMPAVNVVVEGYTVDAYWADAKLVVELDSRRFHMNTKAFEEDRERQAALLKKLYRVLPITWKRLTEQSDEVANDILTLLGQTRSSAAPTIVSASMP
ncbi:MAG: DUF559 domain-containing protein [Thermoleophilaceae bacterium]